MFRLLFLALALSIWTDSGSMLAQQPIKSAAMEKYKPMKPFPKLAVAKYDMRNPNVLRVLLPGVQYELIVRYYELPAADSSVGTTNQEAPASTSTSRQHSINDLREWFGPLEPLELAIVDIDFFTLEGELVPQQEALAKLKEPKHIFYGDSPDAYHRQVVNPDVLVVKIKKELAKKKWLPSASEKYPSE